MLRILTQPDARAEIETAVGLLERVIKEVQPEQLAKRGDPWLYFYEHFLAAYDDKLRKSYGVYYTPQEVITCQVALVSELLEAHFGKRLTFADEGVVFLDSSAGTGAYPLAAIESALQKVEARFGKGAVAEYATRCAQNVYAFEILVGPYAVAHLRLTKLLKDAGAALPADGLRVLLTDTLESPYADPPQPPLFGKKLTDEQRRANRVKAEQPVFVCMGNPPYFREESDDGCEKTRGKWVRFGDENRADESPILADFITSTVGGHAKNLFNLYVYFWRWTLWKMFENGYAERRGVVSFITASSYLRGPGFAGMRQRMREAFDEIWILDLEGDNLGARKTDNVFAIQTPVCVATGIRYAAEKRNALARTRYARITGTREEKLATLKAIKTFDDVKWDDCFAGASEPMLPQRAGNYFAWPLLTDLWPWQSCGVKFERTWPIAETQDVLARRWFELLSASADKKRELFAEDGGRKVSGQYLPLIATTSQRLPSLSSLNPQDRPRVVRYAGRSFDRRFAIADNRIGGEMNRKLWLCHSDRQVYLTSLLTNVLGLGPATTICSDPPDLHHFCGRGAKDVVPLWRDATGTQPNLPASLLDVVGATIGTPATPEDFLAYTYAVLAAPSYVETFSEELTLPGLRLPVTRDAALFARAVAYGRRLLWLHTYGERFVPAHANRGEVPAGIAKCIKAVGSATNDYPENFSWTEGAVPGSGTLRVGKGEFAPVSDKLWAYSVSGYEVVKGWLGFRMKHRSGRKSSPLDDIRPEVWTAALTTELLELLWVLEATIEMQPALDQLLSALVASPTLPAADLPQPTAAERRAPGHDPEEQTQTGWEM